MKWNRSRHDLFRRTKIGFDNQAGFGWEKIALSVPRTSSTESQIKGIDRWRMPFSTEHAVYVVNFFPRYYPPPPSNLILFGYLCPEGEQYHLVREDWRILACLWRYGTVNGRHRAHNLPHIASSCSASVQSQFSKKIRGGHVLYLNFGRTSFCVTLFSVARRYQDSDKQQNYFFFLSLWPENLGKVGIEKLGEESLEISLLKQKEVVKNC